jgi:hypothetical protein
MQLIIKLPTLNTRPLEWQELWDAMDAHPDKWVPTTNHMWCKMRDSTPPQAYADGVFLCSEPVRGDEEGNNLYPCFAGIGRRYYARFMTREEFDCLVKATEGDT